MFKKLKDKVTDEVKSSPNRFQQFAKAAQAAVTSASSSISDITNNDLFSIGDSDNSTKTQVPAISQPNISPNLNQSGQSSDFSDFSLDFEDRQRQRRLSNSSLASDISFRLPNYESPSMYHLQSDMEVSASEAEDRFTGGVNLDRVTKEQLYSAYKRTQDRWKKYKSQYSDLARHYKLLERENAKARNVLVETQDKALRRISELKEQCSLEQSAKAHLEKALRVELEEKAMKIEALMTQLNLLQNHTDPNKNETISDNSKMQLIDLVDNSNDKEFVQTPEVATLNNKVEKLEQLLSKYKESLKACKDKNSNLTTEIQKLNIDLEKKVKENKELQQNIEKITDGKQQLEDLLNKIEDIENSKNTLEFAKNKEISILEENMQSAKQEIAELQKKIKTLGKRDEEYVISLAENKLQIHKELESKESEIKTLKDNLTKSQTEIETLNKTIEGHIIEIAKREEELINVNNELHSVILTKTKLEELAKEQDSLKEKYKSLEISKSKCEEEMNCLHLQVKQETAEKLSVIDRNVYLEERNTQLSEENTKKRTQINKLEEEVVTLKSNIDDLKTTISKQESNDSESQVLRLTEEASAWKLKCNSLESEIQEEREELVKLQSEIEKLLLNHQSLQVQNEELAAAVDKLQSENSKLCKSNENSKSIGPKLSNLKKYCMELRNDLASMATETNSLNKQVIKLWLPELKDCINKHRSLELETLEQIEIPLKDQIAKLSADYKNLTKEADSLTSENKTLILTIKQKESDIASLSENLKSITEENKTDVSNIQSQLNILQNENKELCNKINILNEKNTSLNEELNKINVLNATLKKEMEALQLNSGGQLDEKNNVINELESKLKTIRIENSDLTALKIELENKYEKIESDFNELRITYSKKENDYQALQRESESLKLEQIEIQNRYKKLEIELFDSSKTISELKNNVEILQRENNELLVAKVDKEHKCKAIETELNDLRKTYEQRLQDIDQENVTLKSLHSDIENNFEKVQLELEELKISYNNLEIRKSELEKTIIEFETKIASQGKIIEEQENTISLNDKVCECNSLKEDNRRLRSDIEGLQTYLSKISKENGDLNDKIRGLIASSENSTGDGELRAEIQSGKDKIDDLLRENSLLIEENLELKDQIQSQLSSSQVQNSGTKMHDKELQLVNEKYKNLKDAKNNLESRVIELEQMNNSLNQTMDQSQNNYERLKLSNEKLQRKLDEALVSLRHLHALEENTELEYLRNILYEYLTGSGTHSLTLAKVLAAVVKFDDRQTEQVLIKEKERQGFLHQLGII